MLDQASSAEQAASQPAPAPTPSPSAPTASPHASAPAPAPMPAALPATSSSAVHGGPDGDRFDDGPLQPGERIHQVLIRAGWFVDAITVVAADAEGRERELRRHGGKGGALGVFEVDPSERVRAVEVWYGEFVHGLRLVTTRRQSGAYGRADGHRALIEAPAGCEIAGFHGRSDVFLNALGAHFRPLPAAAPSDEWFEACAPVGQAAGTAFSDAELILLPGAQIVEAAAHYDEGGVRSLEISTRTGRAVLRAGAGEAIDGVDVWAGGAGGGLRALRFHCGARWALAGDPAGREPDASVRAAPGTSLVGFRGTANDRLRSLSVLVAPDAGTPPSPAPSPTPAPVPPAPSPAFAPPPEAPGTPQPFAVTNWRDGDACGHSLPLLRGTCPPACTQVIVTAESLAGGGPPDVRVWPAAGGHWKALVPLRLGTNAVLAAAADEEGPLEGAPPLALSLRHLPGRELRSVRLVYVLARDGDGRFQAPEGEPCDVASACARLQLAGRLMQSFTAEKIFEHCIAGTGPERRTFELQERVHVFRSGLSTAEARGMSGHDLHSRLARELESLPERERTIDVAVMSFTWYDPARYGTLPAAHTALGGGRLALFGSSTLHTFAPSLDELVARFADARRIDTARFFDDSCGRGTHGANFSTGVGAMLHELGHCFGLAHTAHGESIMARGFDRFSRTFAVEEPWAPAPLRPLRWDDETAWHRSSAAHLFQHPFFRTAEMDREGAACRIGDGGCRVQCVDRLAGTRAELRAPAGLRVVDFEIDGNVVAHLEDGSVETPKEARAPAAPADLRRHFVPDAGVQLTLTPPLLRSLLRLPGGRAAGVTLRASDARGNSASARVDIPAPA
eukprot:tig00020723_g13501.t1